MVRCASKWKIVTGWCDMRLECMKLNGFNIEVSTAGSNVERPVIPVEGGKREMPRAKRPNTPGMRPPLFSHSSLEIYVPSMMPTSWSKCAAAHPVPKSPHYLLHFINLNVSAGFLLAARLSTKHELPTFMYANKNPRI
jgi:hypothetical protein